MKVTISVIKADVGSVGGHTKPSERRSPASLAVQPMCDLSWCDLGTPRRVLDLIRARRLAPPWLAAAALA
jgi:hypothetical protein